MSPHVVAAPPGNVLGEGPLYVRSEDALYWVDMLAPALHRKRLADGVLDTWQMPTMICWIVERSDSDGFLIGLRSGIAKLSLDPFCIEPILALDACRTQRLNDGKVDPSGVLWAGTMHETAAEPTGSLYRIAHDLSALSLATNYSVTNGPTFSPDGSFLYHADSLTRTVFRYRIEGQRIADRQSWITFPEDWGLPDGMTTDADGHVWIAHWDGGRLSRFDPTGSLVSMWPLPVSRITSCAFGGERLDRLFVTSAALDCPGEPLAGCVFELEPGVLGLPATPFGQQLQLD